MLFSIGAQIIKKTSINQNKTLERTSKSANKQTNKQTNKQNLSGSADSSSGYLSVSFSSLEPIQETPEHKKDLK